MSTADQHRFGVPSEAATATLADASAALSALFALDAHLKHHTEWLRRASVARGDTPQRQDDVAKDARAKQSVALEQTRALRADLAELAADAEAALPQGAARRDQIVREADLPDLPKAPIDRGKLLAFERSFATALAACMREATQALRPLRDRMRAWENEDARALAERAHVFIVAVHGPERA